VFTLRAQGWQLPKLQRANDVLWDHLAERLGREYQRKHGVPDIIHAHGGIPAALAASDLAEHWGIPAVVTEHSSAFAEGVLSPHQLARAAAGFRRVNRIIVVSRALARTLAPIAGSTPIDVIPNLVDPDFFTLPHVPRAESGTFRFLAVALFLPVKRMDVLVRAFANAFQGRDVSLEIVGGGAGEDTIRRLAKDLGIGAQVHWTGLLPRPEVREAMWRSHALVLSSDVETFGVVAIEAMATGIPVVSTACGGPEDIVREGQSGFLVAPGDWHGLGDAMRRVVVERAVWGQRVDRIREYAAGKFSAEAVVNQLILAYQRAGSR